MTSLAVLPEVIPSLESVAGDYDAAFVDVWGVLHNGVAPYLGAVAACQRFRALRGPVVLVSNSPRSGDEVVLQLRRIGVPDDVYDGVVTSGDATRAALKARAPGPVYSIGPDRDQHLYDGLGLAFADPADAAFVCVTGLFDDRSETPSDYDETLQALKARGLDMICANPDIVADFGGQLIYCAGALAEAYSAMGGVVVLAGKPHAPIYELAFEALDAVSSQSVARERILVVGDGPLTDIRGANVQGLDALFIAGGVAASAFADHALSAEAVGAALAKDGVSARFAQTRLVWSAD